MLTTSHCLTLRSSHSSFVIVIREVKQSSATVVREVQKVVIGSPTQGGQGLAQGLGHGQGLETTATYSLDITQKYMGKNLDKDNHLNLAITNVIIDAIEPAPSSPSSHYNTTHSTNNALILLNTDTTLSNTNTPMKNFSAYIPPRACSHRYCAPHTL